jgi:hypothetical protein
MWINPHIRPLFSGQPIFGDPRQFAANIFNGSAADEDAFLGLTPGTTAYPPCRPPGGAIAIAGALIGDTADDVEAAQATLTGLALVPGEVLVPTGLSWERWDLWSSCWFAGNDLAYDPAGIVASIYGGYQVSYKLILHRSGSLVTS